MNKIHSAMPTLSKPRDGHHEGIKPQQVTAPCLNSTTGTSTLQPSTKEIPQSANQAFYLMQMLTLG